MKRIILSLVVLIGFQVNAKEIELEYEIISDEKKAHVVEGFCEIIGTVRESGYALGGISVKSFDKKHVTTTDKNGKYRFVIPATKTKIYAYHYSYEEVVISEYDFKSGHQVGIDFNLYSSKSYEVEKPVVYIYGESGQKIHIDLKPKGEMAFSYPKYNSGWDVEIGKNGSLLHKGQLYPYLFWDGTQELNFKLSKSNQLYGTIVKNEDVISFLENDLGVYGLNAREKTDFITYWGPRLKAYGKVFVQFLIDDDYDEIAVMDVTPKPESVRRIYMKFSEAKNLDPRKIAPQPYIEFLRKGLTYVEWGGSELPPMRLMSDVELYIDGKPVYANKKSKN